MIRKQLYITEAQEETLKRQARALGVSEAELVRRALDDFLNEGSSAKHPRRRGALGRLIDRTRQLAKGHRLPSDYQFDRDELYAERTSRWTKRDES